MAEIPDVKAVYETLDDILFIHQKYCKLGKRCDLCVNLELLMETLVDHFQSQFMDELTHLQYGKQR